MPDIKPVSFANLMAKGQPAAANPPPPIFAPSGSEALTQVKYFTRDGLVEAARLLKQIRTDKTLHGQDVEDLINDPQYTKPLAGGYAIDRAKVFATKLELCEYFTTLFDDAFLEGHRKDEGIWTWLAFAYYKQFVKTKKDVVQLASDPRWIFDHENYRLSVRHFIAGPIYLYYDFHDTSKEVKDMLFFSPPKEFGGFIDAITYKMEGTRMPVLIQTAACLYYDPDSPKRMKRGVTSQDKPGTVRELLRVVSQLAQTRDFYDVGDTDELLRILPQQFDRFKSHVAD